ncbi:MAG: UvrD-helicase domain-containing protein [Actinomycetia bacterium]|nr:UvrD-helicase domain-containing protein [Actinomycetes bacterium]
MTSADQSRFLRGLNDDQARAVAHDDGPLLVVAGPGSGKTRVLTHRIARLVDDGVYPWRILALTFTNKAAAEMRSRVAELVSEDQARELWVSTFHSFCLRLLRRHPAEAGLPERFTVLDASDAQKVVRDILAETGGDPKEARAVASKISYAKNMGVTPDRLAGGELGPEYVSVAATMNSYIRAVHALGACDFDDILLRARKLLNAHPEVAQKYAERFRYVLVDEFQDTNAIQYDIVRRITEASGNLCVVGDQDQAVYGWRGATEAAVDRFVADHAGVTVVGLGVNYRSTNAIVDCSKAIISHNPSPHRADLRTSNKQGDPVRLLTTDSDLEEASIVAAEMASAVGRGATGAVIVRTNAQTRLFEQALMRRNIRFQVVGAMRFFERAEIKDALAWLRCVHNPWDVVALARAVAAPKRGLGPAAVTKLIDASLEAGTAPGEMLRSDAFLSGCTPKLAETWRMFGAAMDAILDAAATSPVDALEALSTGPAGFKAYLTEQDTSDRDPKSNRVENLAELVNAAEQFMAEVPSTHPDVASLDDIDGITLLEMFLESVTLTGSADSEDTSEEAPLANVVTAHAAKGKEWDHVWVVGLETKLFPHVRAEDDVAEERRLFYVACSRPMQTLVISHAKQRALWGRPEPTEPSMFLDELPPDVDIDDRSRTTPVNSSGWSTGRTRGSYNKSGYKSGYKSGNKSGYKSGGPKRSGLSGGVAASRRRRTSIADIAARGDVLAVPKATPAVPTGPRLDPAAVVVGIIVEHSTFGKGTVEAISGSVVDVKFADRNRSLDLDFAPLTLAA